MARTQPPTFLFADLVGFTAFTEREGDEAAADLALDFAATAARAAGDHGARVVKCLGDAVLLHVGRAADAVELGLHVNSEWHGGGGLPRVHAGAHTGPAVERGGDWFGAAVNLAARVCCSARAGELLVTEATAAAAGDLPGIELNGLGPQAFKNVARSVPVFAAQREPLPRAVPSRRRALALVPAFDPA
jgi:class 3 adenylate cyclase